MSQIKKKLKMQHQIANWAIKNYIRYQLGPRYKRIPYPKSNVGSAIRGGIAATGAGLTYKLATSQVFHF